MKFPPDGIISVKKNGIDDVLSLTISFNNKSKWTRVIPSNP